MTEHRVIVTDQDTSASERDALANMQAACERRIDGLTEASEDLDGRVARLEATVAKLREEIKAAAHELKDDHAFMSSYSQKVTDHGTEHLTGKVGRMLLKWLGVIAVGVLIFLAGKWGIIK